MCSTRTWSWSATAAASSPPPAGPSSAQTGFARFLLGILAREQPGDAIDRVVVNGALGFAVYQQGQLVTIVSVTAAAGRVTRLDLIRAPGKLPRLAR